MSQKCSFCGEKLFLGGWPIDGQNACRECFKKWREKGRMEFLLEGSEPQELFHIDNVEADAPGVDEKKLNGSLLFLDKAIVFLSSSSERKRDLGLTAVGGALGGALGSLIAGAIQDKRSNKSRETAPEADSL